MTTDTTTAGRLDRLRAALDERGLDAILITDPINRRYLSGFTGSNGILLIGRETAQIATDFRYWEQARQQAAELALFESERDLGSWFGRFVAPFGRRKIGFEAAHVTVDLLRQFRELIGELSAEQRPELVPTVGLVEALRAIKEPEEIAVLERVIGLGDAAFAHVAPRIEPGWTEQQVAWEIEKYIREHGGEAVSFPTIIAGGPAGAMPHARARNVPLKAGEGVVIDMGAVLDGYCSDMTRTIFLGEPDAKFKAIYDIVLTAQLTAEELIEDGMDGATAHNLAYKVIEEAGYGEAFGHGLGHGIGLQVHEEPWLRPTSKSILRNGMVFSVEPGIYLTGWGGVRIEDLVLLENGRCRVLTGTRK